MHHANADAGAMLNDQCLLLLIQMLILLLLLQMGHFRLLSHQEHKKANQLFRCPAARPRV